MKRTLVLMMFLVAFFLGASAALAQTFQVEGQQPEPQKKPSGKAPKGKAAPSAPSSGIGWGSSIEVGRMARAAEQALKRRDYASATNFAQRAVNAAPQNGKLWFLLGYTSRLSGRYQASADAYQKGLSLEGTSPDGISGLAQTYAKMGKVDEAKRMLMQVINAHPDRMNDILIAGELYMKTGEPQTALNLLQRAEAKKPSTHVELLMAMAYLRMKQPQRAKALLDRAKARNPKNVDIFRAVATYYRETHDYKQAIATLKSSPRMTPEVLADLAFSYELNGDVKQSAATYVKAANADPKKIGLQLSAGQALIRTGDVEKGKTFLARAEAIDPNHYRLHSIRGGLAKSENRAADAIREYLFALNHLPEVPPEGQLYPVLLRLNLAELYRMQNDEANAKQQMVIAEQAMSKMQVEGPQRAEFLRVRASVRLAFGDPKGAESDLNEAMKIDPANTNINLQYATLLWKTDRKEQARNVYNAILQKDPKNRYALEGSGYLARDMGDRKSAEQFFTRLAQAYPDDYIAYLALGDMYTDARDFQRADANYQLAWKRAPKNATVVANGANAAIEARKFELAKTWVDRATGTMVDDPRVMRERERYLFHAGKYAESAALGRKVLQQLPKDRNASVYLGYSLYNLGRYDDVLSLASKYEEVLPKEPNFPLLAGHVHKQSQLLSQSVDDYTRALERDPKMVEAWVNRGYVYNDLQNAEGAVEDFDQALKLAPKNGTAHLGLAFSNLQLHRGKAALQAADEAEKLMGESGATHLARATAYRQMRSLTKAEKEYRVALKYAPDDFKLHMALANTLFNLRRYNDSIAELQGALRLTSDQQGDIYAQLAHAYAQMGNRPQTLRYIEAAERESGESSAVLLNTGGALMELGDTNSAMDRFVRALNAPDADRISARLAIAKLFVRDGKFEDAKQQVSLAFAESRVGEASPIAPEDLVEAANIFLGTQDFDLAQRYFERAKAAGAGEEGVAVGLANTYLAKGNDRAAEAELASLGNPQEYSDNYDYQLAYAGVYRHRGDTTDALTGYARANALAGDSDAVAQRLMLESAAQEGMPIGKGFTGFSDFSYQTVMNDATIYTLDTRILGVTDPRLLPSIRAPQETRSKVGVRYHGWHFAPVIGTFEVRNLRGLTSLPSESFTLNVNTYDYNFAGGIAPTLRLGSNVLQFNGGLQYTLRRDSHDPLSALIQDQNLFRQYVYVNSSSFFNWVSFRASGYHEAGPFTNRNLSSSDVAARLEFTVGRPWGKNALITGYSARDLQYNPLIREYFTTSTWAGYQRSLFDRKASVTVLGEYIRAWRVRDQEFAIAQAMRPAVKFSFTPNPRWAFEGMFAYNRGEGFHAYDNTQSEFLISYQKPLHRNVEDGGESIPVGYPLRFSVGIQQQNFMNFTGRDQAIFRPVFRLSLF